jgi:8-oxo-dGTP diphosphatase
VMLPRISLGACAIIQDARGQVLVVRHTYRTPAWGLPGGFVRRREDPAKALVRELQEELGVQVALGPILSAERHIRTGHLTLYYSATLLNAPTVDQVELDGLRYTQPEELLTLYGAEARKWFPQLAKAS